jgi:hypothetical protein
MQLYNDLNKKCNLCKKELSLKAFHIDHILPLSRGGNNENENLQILCKLCHFDKTRQEQNDNYVKESDTESSFNFTTKEIMNSSLNSKYAFVEKMNIDQKYDSKLTKYYVDINKCRKSILYFSKYPVAVLNRAKSQAKSNRAKSQAKIKPKDIFRIFLKY